MDLSPSAHSPDVRESRPSFRKPANETSRRNYRRHSPSSSHSRTPSPGGWKRDRSPSCVSQEDGVSKKGRNFDLESDKGRGDARFRRGTDTGSRGYGSYGRERHGRAEDHDHNYNRRHVGYHDRSYHNSVHARAGYSRYDDGRYDRQSPERFARIVEEAGHRRRENRASERDRDRDDRISDTRAADRDRNREDDLDVRDRYKMKDREARQRGRERFGEKERDDGSDVEAERSRHGKRIDDGIGCNDVNDVEGRDRDTDKVESKERHKSKADLEKLKEKESRRREREEGKGLENDKDDGSRHRSRDKGHRGHDEHRKKSNLTSESRKDYSSDEPEGTGELLRERSHRQDNSRKGEKDKKQSGEKAKSNHTSSERLRGVQDAGVAVATSDHSDESKRLDDKSIKGSKWGPEAENSDTNAAASSDPEVAKMAAMKAAALVNINLGGLKSVDEKKKMLWGSKEQKPAVASGTNRWDTVRFADRDRQEKFHKLMGVKGEAEGGQGSAGNLFTTEKQEELQQDLEKQFTAGLRRRDGRTVGLGL
eukprot:c20347_g1_i1 orf=206-1819(+)